MKLKKWHWIVLALLVIGIIGNLLSKKENKKEAAAETPWEQKSYEQKQKWIEAYLKAPDDAGYQLVTMMDEEIKKQFKYPKEVDYDVRPTLNKAWVSSADSGWVFVKGSGTGKNAFGVKQAFKYQCRLSITPTKRILEEVKVSFDE